MPNLGARKLELLRKLVSIGRLDDRKLDADELRLMFALSRYDMVELSAADAHWYPTDYGREVAGA